MSLIRSFQMNETQPLGAARRPGEFRFGGRFDVAAEFERDRDNRYRRLEYRQYIRGQTLVDGHRIDNIFIPGPHGPRSIDPLTWLEDGAPHLGPRGFYGHRSPNAPLEEDQYFSRVPRTGQIICDMFAGNFYASFDFYSVRIPTIGPLYEARKGKTLELNLEFKGLIVECSQPGGANDRVHEQRLLRKQGLTTIP